MKYNINLATHRKQRFSAQLTYFISNYLRYILVFTQLIVIGVLFYRFRIDQNIIDLKESVDQKKEILKVTSPLLTEAQTIEAKSTGVEKILSSQNRLSTMLFYTFSKFPAEVTLTKAEIDDEKFIMTGSASNPQYLQSYVNALSKDKRYATVQLKDLKKEKGVLTFSLVLSNFDAPAKNPPQTPQDPSGEAESSSPKESQGIPIEN